MNNSKIIEYTTDNLISTETAIKDEKAQYKLVIGDWNSKIVRRMGGDTEHISKYGLPEMKEEIC